MTMGKLQWHKTGEKLYETGVSETALYVMANGAYGTGVAWNGVTKIGEAPSGAEPTPIYADNSKYVTLTSAEEFGASIEAYTYPDEFAICDGSAELMEGIMIGQQPRSKFGLVYKTVIGNDVEDSNYGYKLHIIYGAQAAPSEVEHATINDSPEAITFSWELTTTPVEVAGKKPTSKLTIDSTKVDASKLAKLEDKLYGSTTTAPTLLTPNEIVALLGAA